MGDSLTSYQSREWFESVFPNDLGDNNHRWSWLVKAHNSNEISMEGKDLLWLHRCNGKWSTSWIDLTSGTKHRLVSGEPLHIEPSVLCPAGCGDHGFIRGGLWVIA